MSVYVYELIESALETLCQYILMISIDRNSRLRIPYGAILLVTVISFVSVLFSYFRLPFPTPVIIVAYALIVYLLSSLNLVRTLIDTALSSLAFFLMEFALLLSFRAIWGESFSDDHRIVLLLLGISLLICVGIQRFAPETALLKLRYNSQIPLAVLLCGDIVIFTSIITNLWNRDSAAFFADFGSILLQILLFCLITCTLGYLLAGYVSQRSRNKIMAEYNALLEQTMEDMRQREHEYKNELNVIISIAERQEPYSLDMISSYAQQLYMEAKGQPAITLVKDNTVMSFLLLRYNQMANRRAIPFSAKICAPFPTYPIREKDLLEMVSNLLNNAFEATCELPKAERSVLISFDQDKITVENTFPAEEGNLSTLTRLAMRGYSTKGGGRGHGLPNVMKIADRYPLKTRMYVKENVFCFQVIFSSGD